MINRVFWKPEIPGRYSLKIVFKGGCEKYFEEYFDDLSFIELSFEAPSLGIIQLIFAKKLYRFKKRKSISSYDIQAA
jgi:N-acetylneuraminic acid mutarotase